jgi:hypothetical protein
MGSTSTR